jgi:periplasmic protein TonB
MKRNIDKIPDFDDLIFESRNKEYGAYKLRKGYKYVLLFSTIVVSFIACCVVVIPFLAEKASDRVVSDRLRYVVVDMDAYIPPQQDNHLQPPPPAAKQMQEIQYVPPEVVDSINNLESVLATSDEALAHTSDTTVVGDGSGSDIFSGEGGQGNGDAYMVVENMPRFMGGDLNKFRQWIQRRTIYPQEAFENNIRGTVSLTFIIEKDGTVTNVTVVKGAHPFLDNEAVRVVSSSPRWSPGLQRGQAVRVRCSVSLIF